MPRALAPRIGAVILGHDVTKTALLDADIPWEQAGRASYETLYALARAILGQRRSVIIDSPCFYQRILDEGLPLATDAGARYCYLECSVPDLAESARRLRERAPRRSQRRDLYTPPPDAPAAARPTGDALFETWRGQMKRPPTPYLRIDTGQPLAASLPRILAYLLPGHRARDETPA